MHTEQSHNQEQFKPNIEQAAASILRADIPSRGLAAEADFIKSLQGEEIRSIGKYQVYSDYSPEQTVVFIHEPTGRVEHKYIFAETGSHTYIVAAPLDWVRYHREILRRVSLADGERAYCPGGGYVGVAADGSISVYGSSGDFGDGDHDRAREAFTAAVKRSAQ